MRKRKGKSNLEINGYIKWVVCVFRANQKATKLNLGRAIVRKILSEQ